ncbi:MAG: hypothetical protein ACLP00_08545 [Terracidiphilus sp.]
MRVSIGVRIFGAVAVGCFGCLLFSTREAQAASDTPTIQGIDETQFCPPSGEPVSRNDLARALLAQYNVPQALVDWTDTGVIGEKENTRAVSVILCEPPTPTTPRQIALCWAPPDKKTGKRPTRVGSQTPLFTDAGNRQEQLVMDLDYALNDAKENNRVSNAPGAFKLPLKKRRYSLARSTPPTV